MDDISNTDNVYRYALYIGSFAVKGNDHHERISTIHKELEALRVFNRSKRITVCVTIKGIKICSEDGLTVFMAHALRRISYATCDAAFKQVAFLAREPAGEASLQYCHVFVTETSPQAEELNRIVGDAFQLAYVRQRLTEIQCNGDNGSNANEKAITRLPRLCDQHSRWPVQPTLSSMANSDSSHANGNNASVLDMLELPPPPTCPPPPLSNRPESDFPIVSAVGDAVPLGRSASDPTNPLRAILDCGLADNRDAVTAPDLAAVDQREICNSSDELENRFRRISTPQAAEAAFRRRHFLHRGMENRFSGIADMQILGGSTRQPKRRQGLSWTNLFASTRHSAFIPGVASGTDREAPDLLDILSAQRSPQKQPHIFVDLRTFAGGSPVVALKERLDAQAVADAKANAFAEAAAVLAAAKQASECTNSPSRPDEVLPSRVTPVAIPVVTSTSPCSTTTGFIATTTAPTHNEPNVCLQESAESPPTPPVRMHSLRRGLHLSPANHPSLSTQIVSSSFPERIYDEAETEVKDRRADATTVISHRRGVSHSHEIKGPLQHSMDNGYPSRRLDAAVNSPSYFSRQPVSSRLADAAPVRPRQSALRNVNSQSSSMAIADNRTRQALMSNTSSPPFRLPATSIASQTNQNPVRTRDHRSTKPLPNHRTHVSIGHPTQPAPGIPISSYRAPLHVTVAETSTPRDTSFTSSMTTHMGCVPTGINGNSGLTHSGWTQQQMAVDGSNVMSTSTFSAETPTPTATPTPTQTPQPSLSNSHDSNNAISMFASSPEEWEFLKHAPWYQALLPREIAFELLAREEGLDKEWPSLKALITHLTVMPEMLPCPLRLPAHMSNPIFTQADERPSATGCNPQGSDPILDGSGSSSRRNLRATTHAELLQSVSSLPSRPVPPSCASRSYSSKTNGSAPSAVITPHCVSAQTSSFQPLSNVDSTNGQFDNRQLLAISTACETRVHERALFTTSDSVGTNVINPSSNFSESLGATGHWDQRREPPIHSGQGSAIELCEAEDEDEDYQRLSDFSSILADLKLKPDREVTSC
ncbi:Tensin-4 [Paragonimus heterotremus]|uniref:Tensin-4 n=1 Tax=Paragonimus heterotremus TaxID=100268 RepID=A0A8J4TK70_9TREM|nr:Tensin-4 [Paragonimus heterotremus]